MSVTAAQIERLDEGDVLRVRFADGRSHRYHALWLRDNAADAATRSAGNGQRLITVLDIAPATCVAEARLADGGATVQLHFEPEDRWIDYSAAWLAAHAYDHERASKHEPGWTGPEIERWTAASMHDRVPVADWNAARTDRAALGRWLAAVRRFGFAVMRGAPAEPGSLVRVAELFGYVRETNYGRWFEVRAEVNPSNLAYTNLGLQAHTDNPYRDPVPTLQILACLENSVEGGESVVVDGFAISERLRQENPEGFALLARHAARFEYAGSAGVCLRSKRPMIELGPDGELLAVRFNNRSAAALVDVPFDDMPGYYAAYRRFAECVENPAFAVRFKLRPGELFIVDNTRVLHARTAFSGSGQRWLQGCYPDKDGLLSTLAAIERERGEALLP
jgi:gamma-butyrobetaine dioxygenase